MQKGNQIIRRLVSLRETRQFPLREYGWYHQHFNPPVMPDDVIFAEKLLGFALPPFLKRVYLEVGNGGFGPGYGLAPLLTPTLFPDEDLDEFPSLVHTTLEFRGYKDKKWPETLLYICDWGCNIYSSIDCASPSFPIVRTEQTYHYGIEASSLEDWLEQWLDERPMFRGSLIPW